MSYDFNIISKPIIPQDEWQLTIYPYGIDFDGSIIEWAFCLPQYMIINEQFTNGTQKTFSYWYQKLTGKPANQKSAMKILFSKSKLPDATTEWDLISLTDKDPSASWCTDTNSGCKLWLCPLWGKMWGGQPNKLWLSILPTD